MMEGKYGADIHAPDREKKHLVQARTVVLLVIMLLFLVMYDYLKNQ